MEQEKKTYKFIGVDEKGEKIEKEIDEEELGKIFFNEGDRIWDNIQICLPDPVWEEIHIDGALAYEGFTLNHKPYGAGKVFYKNGKPKLEGIFGCKGLVCGREYYANGVIRFEGQFKMNRAYGPNFPEYGTWYDQSGKVLFHGKFGVGRSSLGWPRIDEPKGFGGVPDTTDKYGVKMFMWEDAREMIIQRAKEEALQEKPKFVAPKQKKRESTMEEKYDEDPCWPAHYRQGMPSTESALRLGIINEKDVEDANKDEHKESNDIIDGKTAGKRPLPEQAVYVNEKPENDKDFATIWANGWKAPKNVAWVSWDDYKHPIVLDRNWEEWDLPKEIVDVIGWLNEDADKKNQVKEGTYIPETTSWAAYFVFKGKYYCMYPTATKLTFEAIDSDSFRVERKLYEIGCPVVRIFSKTEWD